MNDYRRRMIRAAIKALHSEKRDIEAIRNLLEEVLDDEQEARDNTPESLQESDRYLTCEESCDLLEQAIDELDEEADDFSAAIDALESIDGV